MLDKPELMVRLRTPHYQRLVSSIRALRAQTQRQPASDVRIGQAGRLTNLALPVFRAVSSSDITVTCFCEATYAAEFGFSVINLCK